MIFGDQKEELTWPNSYSRKIQERIRDAAEGTVFIGADFADIADTETVRRNLNRLTQAGLIRRILKGVYEKPEYSEMLKEYVAADPGSRGQSAGSELSLEHCPVREYSSEFVGTFYTGNRGLVLYQRWSL